MNSRIQIDWSGVRADAQFLDFNRRKQRFLATLLVVSLSFFMLLPVGAAFFPELLARRVFGVVNVGILLALAEFFAAWLIAWIYTRRANREFDPAADKLFLLALDHYRKR